MSEGRNKVRAHALPASGGAAARRPASETPSERRARDKRKLDDAQRAALAEPSNRAVLAGLAKR
jgi:hypothetical protein